MSIVFERVDGPFGVWAHGIPFDRPLTAAERTCVLQAIDEHLVVLFHNDEPLSPAQVEQLCRAFGPLKPTLADRSRLRGHPGINRVSNRDADDGVIGTGGAGSITFHSDLSFSPPLIEFLYLDALVVPAEGGDTKWVDLRAAYDDLPQATKNRIDDLGVHYRLRDGLDFNSYFKASDSDVILRDETAISLVQTNPRTGRKSVWPNTGPDFSARVEGMSATESVELLRDLFEHCTQDRYVYRHHWRVGDGVVWINTQTMHEREPFPSDQLRVLRHVNILGVADPRQLAA